MIACSVLSGAVTGGYAHLTLLLKPGLVSSRAVLPRCSQQLASLPKTCSRVSCLDLLPLGVTEELHTHTYACSVTLWVTECSQTEPVSGSTAAGKNHQGLLSCTTNCVVLCNTYTSADQGLH